MWHNLPLTVRQIFYRLVGAHGYDKTENAYSRLGEKIKRARRAGLIPFEAIRDDGVTIVEPDAWDRAAQLVESFIEAARNLRLDRQVGQPRRLVFAVEAAGMVPQVQRIADPFGIAVHSSGGFDSLTAKHDLAHRLGRSRRVEVLHVGDHDPSGVHLFRSMEKDVRAIARDLGLAADIGFSRLAVVPAQIVSLDLVTAPPKATDRRSFTGETVQCEAIPPDVLAGVIRDAIESRIDKAAYAAVLAEEEVTRERLAERLLPLMGRTDHVHRRRPQRPPMAMFQHAAWHPGAGRGCHRSTVGGQSMSAARVEADWIPRRGPDQCPPEYRPWLDAVAVAWDTPVQRIWWRSRPVVVPPSTDPPTPEPKDDDPKAP